MSSIRAAYETDIFTNSSGILSGTGRGRAIQVPATGGTVVMAAHGYCSVYALSAGLEFAPTDNGPWMKWKRPQPSTTEDNPLFIQITNAPAGVYFRAYVSRLQGASAQVAVTVITDDRG